jgi:hypothetical protein
MQVYLFDEASRLLAPIKSSDTLLIIYPVNFIFFNAKKYLSKNSIYFLETV